MISIVVDAGSPLTVNLDVPSEDVLIRTLLGQLGPGTHTVAVTQAGANGTYFYFDFLEIAIPSTTLPTETTELSLAAATDWDTNHSLALAPERTAGMIYALGFRARVNHYAGALWFYELNCVGPAVRIRHGYLLGIAGSESHYSDHPWHYRPTLFDGQHH